MLMQRSLVLSTALLCLGSTAWSAQAPDQAAMLKTTLERLKAASARFNSAEATVERDAYTALVKEHEQQSGSLYVVRAKDGKTEMGLRTEGKEARVVEYKNGTLKDFNPGTKCFNAVNKPGIDTYLTLGFGGSPEDLQRAWQITDLGPETLAGVKVEKLDLVPKDSHVRENVSKVTLWMDLERDVTLKQIFFSPSNDTNTAVYSNIQLNKHINAGPYAIKGGACK